MRAALICGILVLAAAWIVLVVRFGRSVGRQIAAIFRGVVNGSTPQKKQDENMFVVKKGEG